MIKLIDLIKEVKIIYKDKSYEDGNFNPIKTRIKYKQSDIDGIILKLLVGEASYNNGLTVIYPYKSEPESFENRAYFHHISEEKLKELYNKLIGIFSKKEYTYNQAKNLLETISDSLNPKTQNDGVSIEDILEKIPSNLLLDKRKKYIEDNFDDLYSYFDDVFNPETLILKSPEDLADYFNFVYDIMTGDEDLDIVEWGEYFRNYYEEHIK